MNLLEKFCFRIGFILLVLILALAGAGRLLLFLTSVPAAALPASDPPVLTDWVFVTGFTGTLSVIDARTDIVYGPVLSGELGTSSGGLLDVDITPDGQTALVSNFGDSAVFFVDISSPVSPSVMTSVTLPIFAEDIAISHDGRYALVTDGGLSSIVATIDISSQTMVYTTSLGSFDAQAVDIAPDGTVVVADYLNGMIHSLYLDPSGFLTLTGSYSYTVKPDGSLGNGLQGGAELPWPTNIAIAPDGQTVLVLNAFPYNITDTLHAIGVYQITAPGILTFTDIVTNLSRAAQSAAFSRLGDQVYLAGNGGPPVTLTADSSLGAAIPAVGDALPQLTGDIDPQTLLNVDQIAVLTIDGPGQVSLYDDVAADLPRITSGHFFGVDTIGEVNNKAYVGYPSSFNASNDLRVVNLTDFSVKSLNMEGNIHGVAVLPLRETYLPAVQKGP